VLYAGALGWWVGLVGQVLWNALGALEMPLDGPGSVDTTGSATACIVEGLRTRHVSPGCAEAVSTLATTTMVAGLLSLWWNPCQASKLHGVSGQIVGLTEFYKLQGIVAAARFFAWYMLKNHHLDRSITQATHAIMLVLNLVVSKGGI
jgi:hypothetical protein